MASNTGRPLYWELLVFAHTGQRWGKQGGGHTASWLSCMEKLASVLGRVATFCPPGWGQRAKGFRWIGLPRDMGQWLERPNFPYSMKTSKYVRWKHKKRTSTLFSNKLFYFSVAYSHFFSVVAVLALALTSRLWSHGQVQHSYLHCLNRVWVLHCDSLRVWRIMCKIDKFYKIRGLRMSSVLGRSDIDQNSGRLVNSRQH